MAWTVRLVKIGADGEEQWVDVMQINRSDDLGDIANLGLTLAEGTLVLAGLQREIVAGKPAATPLSAGRIAETAAVLAA